MNNIKKISGLTNIQEGILYHSLRDTDEYIVQKVIKFEGVLDADLIYNSLCQLHEKIDILRSDIVWDKVDQPLHIILNKKSIDFDNCYLSKADEISELLCTCRKQINIMNNKLINWKYINLNNENGILVFTHHHILLDGWSVELVIKNLKDIFEGNKIQINNSVFEEYKKYEHTGYDWKDEVYWSEYLENHSGPVNLNNYFMYPNEKESMIDEKKKISFHIESDLYDKVKLFSMQNNFSLNTILQGTFELLLKRLTSKNNQTYGVTLSGRNIDILDIEDGIGLFIRTLPIKINISEDTSIIMFFRSIEQKVKDVEAHQNISLDKISEICIKNNEYGDLFNILYVFENFKEENEGWGEYDILSSEVKDFSHYDLSFILNPFNSGICLNIKYSSSKYTEYLIENIGTYFLNILEIIVNNGHREIKDISLLKNNQIQKILSNSQGDYKEINTDKVLVDIYNNVRNNPEKIAIIEDGEEYTYGNLGENVKKYTELFSKCGVTQGDKVTLYLTRQKEIIFSMLALWELDACFVLCDKNSDAEKIKHIIHDSKSTMVVVSNAKDYDYIKNLNDSTNILDIYRYNDTKMNQINNDYNPVYKNRSAYVMYTSGSTGKPKGVEVTHKNLVNYFNHCKDNYMKDDGFSILHSTVSFDLTLTSIFLPLIEGRTLVISTSEKINNLAEILREYRASFIKLTPSHMEILILEKDASHILNNCKTWIVGGESFSNKLLNRWNIVKGSIRHRFINEYGPTETTIGCSTYECNGNEENIRYFNSVPIGRPINNTSIYVLDDDMRIQPPFVKGNIYISGYGVSNGYLNNQEKNEQVFVKDIYSNNYCNMYKSGDVGFYDDDGLLHCLGRIDNQLKIRGHRIEIGEIEEKLKSILNIDQIAVKYFENIKSLVAYSNKFKYIDKKNIYSIILGKLPIYMIPDEFVFIETLPINQNMKIDYGKLDFNESDKVSKCYSSVTKEVDKVLEIFESVLGYPQMGLDDNLFTLGGNSLKSMKIISKINRVFDTNLTITDILENPTVEGISKLVEKSESKNSSLEKIRNERMKKKNGYINQ